MTAKFSALVLGATGLVGKELLTLLLDDERYARITCLVRNQNVLSETNNAEHLLVEEIDFSMLAQQQIMFNVDHVYVCLGTTIKQAKSQQAFRFVDYDLVLTAARLSAKAPVKSFVWISSIGANANSNNFYLRVKGELEQAIDKQTDLAHAIPVRPSLLLGKRKGFRLGEVIGKWVGALFGPLFVGGLRKYRPIHAKDVAKEMIDAQRF